jgi:hypothetical protein
MTRALLILLVLSGCKVVDELSGIDQCMRREIFQQCLKALPAGPQATKYNDWDEVVASCESAAYYQSKRKMSVIKEECRS